DPKDLWQLSPAGVLTTLLGWVLGRGAGAGDAALPAGDLSERDPGLVRLFVDFFRGLRERHFRLEGRGVEHLPAAGPALTVGSHNGGPIPTDTFLTLVAVWDRFGPERALHTLVHDLLFYNQMTRKYALRLGMLRARHETGALALRAGRLVLLYPGSD